MPACAAKSGHERPSRRHACIVPGPDCTPDCTPKGATLHKGERYRIPAEDRAIFVVEPYRRARRKLKSEGASAAELRKLARLDRHVRRWFGAMWRAWLTTSPAGNVSAGMARERCRHEARRYRAWTAKRLRR